jgi:hypothetical protein
VRLFERRYVDVGFCGHAERRDCAGRVSDPNVTRAVTGRSISLPIAFSFSLGDLETNVAADEGCSFTSPVCGDRKVHRTREMLKLG